MNFCPRYVLLRAANSTDNSVSDQGAFESPVFELLDDMKLDHIKAIRANTPFKVAIRLFACQNLKDLPDNYCSKLSNIAAQNKICESNKTNYIFMYVDKSNQEAPVNRPKEPVYFVAFVRYSRNSTDVPQIITEVKNTVEWLGINGSIVQCYIFYYSTTFLCNTFDWGTLKGKFNNQCKDGHYSFQFQYIPPGEEPRWININGGSPKFTICVQEM